MSRARSCATKSASTVRKITQFTPIFAPQNASFPLGTEMIAFARLCYPIAHASGGEGGDRQPRAAGAPQKKTSHISTEEMPRNAIDFAISDRQQGFDCRRHGKNHRSRKRQSNTRIIQKDLGSKKLRPPLCSRHPTPRGHGGSNEVHPHLPQSVRSCSLIEN
jgi:hypothetical protein